MKGCLTNEEFVKMWVLACRSGQTAQQLAELMNVKKQSVIGRGHRLRKIGVRLPKLAHSLWKVAVDVDHLNSIIDGEEKG